MTLPSQPNRKPLVSALVLLTLLSGSVVAIAILFDFTGIDLSGALFLMALVCCIFIAKNSYDLDVANLYTQELEQSFEESLSVASQDFYSQIYQNSPIPYVMINIDGQVRSGNVASMRILELTRQQLEGANIFNLIACEETQHLDFLIEKYRSGIALSDELVKIKRRNGAEVWALLSLFKLTSAKEHLGLLTLVDITKQKQVENAKTQFVSLASHQLRTPIAAIKWSAELLQMDNEQPLSDRQKKYIERLLQGTRQMGLIVDDFLRVSRFELGTFQPEYVPVQLSGLVQDIIQEQSVRINQKNLTVKSFFDSSIETITTDQSLIRMIISNLLSNAVKYTREGGTVHVGFGKKDDDILFSVADNGMGIPSNDQGRVFSKLFRAANAARSVPDGTGLGLYIVKEAVLVLHGNISFTSTENVGTTFEVVLPLQIAATK